MSALGGPLSLVRSSLVLVLAALSITTSGCVQHAVFENDVRSAIWKSRTLSTAADLQIAHAALSAQLVELEALYQRNPTDERVRLLLARGYALMARGFVQLRYLEALIAGDHALAERELSLQADAEARARYYATTLAPERLRLRLYDVIGSAQRACQSHDRTRYEAELNQLLQSHPLAPEQQLDGALAQALARAWLQENVARRCAF